MIRILIATAISALLFPSSVKSEVKESSKEGFQIVISQGLEASPKSAYATMITDFGEWWGGDHSHSGNGANLSMDLERKCMYEKLPDGGFVRHLEIVHHQPGQTLTLHGGLGPLQPMGVHGAMMFRFKEVDGKSKLTLTYNVVGASFQNLNAIAPAVDKVLTGQLSKLGKHVASQKTKPETKSETSPTP